MDRTPTTANGILPAVSRRRALQGLGGGLAATVLAGALARGESAPATPAPAPPGTPRRFELTAAPCTWELMPGLTVPAFAYNGQLPGPEIRVTEGDLVQVTLKNRLPVPTTIHWHGVHLHPAMDGPAGLNQAAVPPGEDFTYEFTATPPGTRWYHSHADPALQVPIGLYGPLIIEPRVPTRPYTYDREHTLVLGEWDLELTPDVVAGTAPRGPKDRTLRGGELGADLFLLNGHMHGAIPPIRIATGERILLRVINAGHHAHPIHIHGHSFKLVATDGNPVPMGMEWTKDTVLVGPAERYDLELEGTNPGVWMVHCHIEHHMANGMMTVLQYDGYAPTGPAKDLLPELTDSSDAMTGMDHGEEMPGMEHGTPEATPVAPETPVATPSSASGTTEIAMLDDRFQPTSCTIPAGTTVTWVNRGADWHNVSSTSAGFSSDRMAPGDTFSHTFPDPGTFPFVCRHHGLAGMNGVVTVTPETAHS